MGPGKNAQLCKLYFKKKILKNPYGEQTTSSVLLINPNQVNYGAHIQCECRGRKFQLKQKLSKNVSCIDINKALTYFHFFLQFEYRGSNSFDCLIFCTSRGSKLTQHSSRKQWTAVGS